MSPTISPEKQTMSTDIVRTLKHAARFRINPEFTLWHTTSRGEYALLKRSGNPEEIAIAFRLEAIKPETCGLEIKCDGVRVSI